MSEEIIKRERIIAISELNKKNFIAALGVGVIIILYRYSLVSPSFQSCTINVLGYNIESWGWTWEPGEVLDLL